MTGPVVKFHHHVDLVGNELRNAIVQRVAALPPASAERAGWIVFSETDGRLYYCTGTTWQLRATDADNLAGNAPAYFLDRANHTGSMPATVLTGLAAAMSTVPLNSMAPATGPVNLGGQELTNGKPASAPNSIPTWAQVTDLVTTSGFRHVRLGSTGNVSIGTTGAGALLDGATLTLGDRVLLKDQANPVQNGVYVVEQFMLRRAPDSDTAAEIPAGTVVVVDEGAVNADRMWMLTSAPGFVVDVDPLTFSPFGVAPNVYSAGDGITIVANTVSAVAGAGIVVNASGISVDPAVTAPLAARLTALENSRGVAGGLATLDGSGHVGPSQLPIGTTASTVAAGDDPRFTDARAALPHAATHATGGTDPIAPASIGAIPTSAIGIAGGVAPLDSGLLVPVAHLPVGTTAGSIAAGDDPRFTDARTPLPHTHPEGEVVGLTDDLAARQVLAEKDQPGGYVGLNANSKINGEYQVYATQTTSIQPVGNTASVGSFDSAARSNHVHAGVALSGDQTVAGIKTFTSSPVVPEPTTGTQAATKDYADTKIPLTQKGAADGVASLGPGGTVPLTQLSRVWKVVDALPAVPAPQVDDMVVLTTDHMVYRYAGSAWTAVMHVTAGGGFARYQQRVAQSLPHGAWNRLSYEAVVDGSPDISRDATNNFFIINRAGTWRVTFSVVVQGSATGIRVLNITAPGNTLLDRYVMLSQLPATWGNALTATTTARFTAGAQITGCVWQDSGAALNTVPNYVYGEVAFFWEGP